MTTAKYLTLLFGVWSYNENFRFDGKGYLWIDGPFDKERGVVMSPISLFCSEIFKDVTYPELSGFPVHQMLP